MVRVDAAWSRGDVAAAADASRKARMWSIVAASAGGVAVLLWLVLAVLGISTSP